MIEREPIIPEGHQHSYERYGFAPAFRVANTVHVSGIIGRDSNGNVPSTARDEFAAVFEQLGQTLAAAGATIGDIVEITSFHVGFDDMGEFLRAKGQVITEPYPAWTAVGCAGLVDPAARVEVKATAVTSIKPES